ncbi:NAD(P)/FAD-dependent oxidoreductase [Granulicoccus phenolivorans]|uniref:NAD(P)/FAD-dependent oxidoreductase n=1 Tax=Granulicoccus phenolivorans TaxID=266854 RepID=UPI0003FA43A2|nr:NAD(P)/FAD-dependent oxidoreductase [Granulicoccus phenolivorans]
MTLDCLLEPGQWGPLPVANRMFMASITTRYDAAANRAFFAERARGGIGLIITEAVATTADLDVSFADAALTTDFDSALGAEQVSQLKETADAIHTGGARAAIQLSAGTGRLGRGAPDGGPAWSASATPMLRRPDELCRELDPDQIEALIAGFEPAALRVREAGFDAIDVHGNQGNLIDQFLTPVWNRRTDAWGGSFDNRMRFAREIVAAIRRGAGADFPISFRLTARHFIEQDRTTQEFIDIAQALQGAGIDVLIIDGGTLERPEYMFPPYYLEDAPFLTDIDVVRDSLSIPLAATGNLTVEVGDQLLRERRCDFIGLARPLIADPELPRHVAEDNAHLIRPCIRCNEMCVGNALALDPIKCAVNPQVGYPDRRVVPTDRPQHVVVVGAGPAGLEAARVAAWRGHRVDLYERTGAIGGLLEVASDGVAFKQQLHRMVDWWTNQLAFLGVSIHLSHEITEDSPELAEADRVIVAIGSLPVWPNIPGIDGPNVVEVLDFHAGAAVAERVVVCGGGWSGCDAALEMATAGKQVTIVEAGDRLARGLLEINRNALLSRLAEAGVEVRTGAQVCSIGPDAVTIRSAAGSEQLACDSVVLAFGIVPDRVLPESLEDRSKVEVIGDCRDLGSAADAIHEGFLAGLRA